MHTVSHPGPRSARALPGLLIGAALLLLVLAGISLALKQPRYEGKTLVEWIDAMDVPLGATNAGLIASHKTSQVLSNLGPDAIPRLQEVVRSSFSEYGQSQQTFFHLSRLWLLVNRLLPSGNPIQRPGLDPTETARLHQRMAAGAYYVLKLSPDVSSGLASLTAILDARQDNGTLPLSPAFAAIQDQDHHYTQALSNLVIRSTGNRRAFWIASLGHLGPQATGTVDLIRTQMDDPHSMVRDQAIQSLACIAPDKNTFELLNQRAGNPDDRRSVMMALFRIGSRAKPAEALIQRTLKDRDMWTAIYAKMAMDRITSGTNNTGSSTNTTSR